MLTIPLPDEVEARLKGEALRRGLPAEEYAMRLITEHLPPTESGQSLSDLFAEWHAEDPAEDAAEVARRNEELNEFKQSMNRNRLEMEGPDSRRPFP